MAKPSVAQTVAPTLALSQKLFRSAWVMCLNKEIEMNSLVPYIYYTAFVA